jgi:transmembrane protein DUF3566
MLRVLAPGPGYPYNLPRTRMATTTDDPIATTGAEASPIDLPVAPKVEPSVEPRRALRNRRPRPIGPRRTKVTVRRFGVTSVLKVSLIFSFCGMVILWLALLLIFLILQAGGVIDSLGKLIGCVVNEPVGTKEQCVPTQIDAKVVFSYLFLAGTVLSVAGSLVLTFGSVIYNLISDMVGGVEVTLAEKQR